MTALALTRRRLLASSVAAGALPLLGSLPSWAQSPAVDLRVEKREIEIKGRSASVLGVRQSSGISGLTLDPGMPFRVDLQNALAVPTIIHWHGQTPPPDQDGVPEFNVPALLPGEIRSYDFPARFGTHWMHSHEGLQEQSLLAGPLIVRTKEDISADEQEVVVLFQDFSFSSPEELLASLTGGVMGGHDHSSMSHGSSGSMAGHDMSSMQSMAGMDHGAKPDLNDIDYDAYLANDRTLEDPEVVRTERGGRVRLRLINGSAGTAYWIDLGGTEATAIAVDGDPVEPIAGTRFPLAIAQRLDLRLTVPAGAMVPVLAQREGDTARTGILLAAPDASIVRIDGNAASEAPPADLSLERRLKTTMPLATRPVDNALTMTLTGTMTPYAWTIDGRNWGDHIPLRVKKGQRVGIKIVNKTMMAHPMHLHGHHFQIAALDGVPLAGALRDTILVMPEATVDLIFDADNPGRWLFHCHNLMHMATGMMTEVAYDPS
ncbi:MAG: multicopper oxidase family protein [Rhizobiales bacterium]|nr:multicopper oxidase family protein [Hyphomicrobiales bacterium]